MSLSTDHSNQLHNFFSTTTFSENGAVITDLDGTAIHEWDGRYGVPAHVEEGLKAVYSTGRPIVINTLRFALSVMRTFGREWYRMSSAPIPTVLLNGSLIGYIHEDPVGTQSFEEIASYPLQSDELKEVLDLVKTLVHDSLTNLLVFYYPRDWQKGEIIWTPAEETIPQVQEKYRSAALVWSSPLDSLEDKLHEEDINMIFLHADVPTDGRMAYQHSSRRDFFTRKGVDKLWGTQRIAEQLGFRLDASLGAGDTSMDVFLGGVAQAVHVGRALDHHGTLPSIFLSCSEEFGALLKELAALQLAHKTINT